MKKIITRHLLVPGKDGFDRIARVWMRGFTLLEVVLAISIFFIISALAVSALARMSRESSLNSSVDKIVASIEEARVKTLSSENGDSYGVRFEVDRSVLFKSPYDAQGVNNKISYLQNPVGISSVNLAGGGIEVIFEKLSGETEQDGTITVSISDGSLSKIIEIQKTGNVFTQQ